MVENQAAQETKPMVTEAAKDNVPGVRRIVVAVDGSEEAQHALKWALENVIRKDDKVHILHVQSALELYGAVGPAHYMGAAPMYFPPEYFESMRKHQEDKSKSILKFAKDKCRDVFGDLSVEGDVIEGEAREAICSAVEQLHADLLVLGSHGFGALKRAFLGSVSDYCVHHATCPVTVVRPTK